LIWTISPGDKKEFKTNVKGKRKQTENRMISADVFDKEFSYFSLRTGRAPVRKIADKWL